MKNLVSVVLMLGILLSAHVLCAEEMNIVMIPKGSDHVFWDFIRAGMDQAIDEIGNIHLTWRGPAYNDDIDSQIKLVEMYTREGIDAMIIVPTDKQALVEPVEKAAALGIKVIVIDSGLDGHAHLTFIGTNNVEGGRFAAKELSARMNGQGNVAVLRTVEGSASTDLRAEGFLEEIKTSSPDIKVLADLHGGGSLGKSYNAAKKLFGEFQDLDGIFAVNESSTAGVLKALQELGLNQKITFIGFDSSDPLIEGLAQHDIDGLVVQSPKQMGYLGIKAAVSAIQNEPLEPEIFTDVVLATPENYQTAEINQLLYP